MPENKMTNCLSRMKLESAKRRLPVTWKNRVLEYIRYREDRNLRGLEYARMKSNDKNNGNTSIMAILWV